MQNDFPIKEYMIFTNNFYNLSPEVKEDFSKAFEVVLNFYYDCKFQLYNTIAKESWE